MPEAVEGVSGADFDDSAWDQIVVPSHWALADGGRYGRPIFTNMVFPFPLDPTNVPDANPPGDYRRSFELSAGFAGAERVLLRFDGVESRFKGLFTDECG